MGGVCLEITLPQPLLKVHLHTATATATPELQQHHS